MKSIKEIIRTMLCGWHSGNGLKFTRKTNYHSALACYRKALSYADDDGVRTNLIECIARTHARLDNYESALSEAEKCFAILDNFDCSDPLFSDSRKRVESLIDALKKNDVIKIKEMITL